MANGDGKRMTVAIYTHPEFYPPLLNAIDELAREFTGLQIISRNLQTSSWKYPDNVQIISSGRPVKIDESEKASMGWKIKSFLDFTRMFYKSLKREKSSWILCSDPISLFSFRLIRPFLGYKLKLWYHSHDVAELKSMRVYSVGYFAVKSEHTYFDRIDLFTLPSEARLKFYPIEMLKGKWIVVPNYPSLQRMSQDRSVELKLDGHLKLLYQGRISDEHGLEEMVDFIKSDAALLLTIIGPGNDVYIRNLKNRVAELGITQQVAILDPVPYGGLQEITLAHQVGVAINKPVNTLYSTAVMASNKIYEYAAAGLPILYYRDPHYVAVLSKYPWAFPTDLSLADLSLIIREIKVNFDDLSRKAKEDFHNKLNFTVVFEPVRSLLTAAKPILN